MSTFIGLEAVYFAGKPFWAMSYSGGASQDAEVEDAKVIYGFLRSALMDVPKDFPVRGPASYSNSGLSYRMISQGSLEAFSGREEISSHLGVEYKLTFAGGLVR